MLLEGIAAGVLLVALMEVPADRAANSPKTRSHRMDTQNPEHDAQNAVSTKNKKPRKSPTQKQVEQLQHLDDKSLIDTAVEALHVLNRRAKKLRDTCNRYRRASFAKAVEFEKERVYAAKDAFLNALLMHGEAALYTFNVEATSAWYCNRCDRGWGGHDGTCRGCGGYGVSDRTTQAWFIVERGPYRFHSPSVAETLAPTAIPMQPTTRRSPLARSRKSVSPSRRSSPPSSSRLRAWMAGAQGRRREACWPRQRPRRVHRCRHRSSSPSMASSGGR